MTRNNGFTMTQKEYDELMKNGNEILNKIFEPIKVQQGGYEYEYNVVSDKFTKKKIENENQNRR